MQTVALMRDRGGIVELDKSCRLTISVSLILALVTPKVARAQSTWMASFGGAWFSEENWSDGVPNSIGAVANFPTPLSGQTLIELNDVATLGRLSNASRADIQISGDGRFEFSFLSLPSEIRLQRNGGEIHLNVPVGAAGHLDVLTAEGTLLQLSDSLPSAETATLNKRLSGELTFAGAEVSGWAGIVELHEGVLSVNQTSRIGELVIHGGELSGTGSLTIDQDLHLIDGVIWMTGQTGLIAPTIIKTGFTSAQIKRLGHAAETRIDLREGKLGIGDSASLGDSDTPVHVANRNAVVVTSTSNDDSLFLNASSGFGFFGGLILGSANWNGPVDSDGRSIINLSGNFGRLESLRGDTFVFSDGDAILNTSGNTYRGATEIGIPGDPGAGLSLRGDGRLVRTSEININHRGVLSLNESQGQVQASRGRVPDNAPIRMRTGTIEFANYPIGVSERLGDIVLERGVNRLESSRGGPLVQVRSIQRIGNSLLTTNLGGKTVREPRLLIDEPPDLDEFQLVGPWAIYQNRDAEFLTYDPEFGAVALNFVLERQPLSTTDGVQHVFTDIDFLPNDKTVASLINRRVFDLGGNTLNVASGGIISESAAAITNGRLTVGNNHGRELVIHAVNASSSRPSRIEADIVDSADGPTSIALNGSIRLGGNNSYTGKTSIASGLVFVEHSAALPSGTDIEITNGDLILDFESDTPLSFGTLAVRGGVVTAHNENRRTQINAESYALDYGELNLRLTGDGPIVKDSEGFATLGEIGNDYTGNIDVRQGTLKIKSSTGSGRITVRSDAILRFEELETNADIELYGGELVVGRNNPQASRWGGRIEVKEDSSFAMYQDGGVVAVANQFDGEVVLADNVHTRLMGLGDFEFNGLLTVGANSSLSASDGRAVFNGVVQSSSPDAQLDLVGNAEFDLQGAYEVDAATTLAVKRNGQLVRLELDDESEFLSGHGTLANELQVHSDGLITPGTDAEAIGTPTLGNNLIIGPDARFVWQFGDNEADHLRVGGQLLVGATESNPIHLELQNIDQSFDPTKEARWEIMSASFILGFAPEKTRIDDAQLREQYSIPPGALFQIESTATSVDLRYLLLPQLGDFDANGELDVADIDALAEAIRLGSSDSKFDVNGDQSVDLEDHRVWVEELKNTYFGDSNLDGEFSPTDLVIVFQAGLFEDEVPNNATWTTGDWSGDGEFTTTDLVLGFRSGFNIGPRPVAETVPEPVGDWGRFLLLLLLWRRRYER